MKKKNQHHYKLHVCQDGHCHFLTGPEQISWPFWSRDAGIKLIELMAKTFPETEEDVRWLRKELKGIEHEILDRSRIQKRNAQGRFEKGFLMPHGMLYQEGPIAGAWQEFRLGTAPHMAYIAFDPILGSFAFPLFCDFVGREKGKKELPASLNRTAWIRIAEAPAKIITMEELNIVLPKAA